MGALSQMADYIRDHSRLLAVEVVEAVINRMKLDIPQWEKEQAINMYIELLGFFGKALLKEECYEAPGSLLEWSKKNANMQIESNGKISEIIIRYPTTREIFNDLITSLSLELDLSLKEHAFVIKRINQMLDISLNETVFAYERLSEQYKDETEKELAKLSAPIVPVKDNIVILPFIGEINEFRVTYIMDTVVPKIAGMDVDHVICDFSGILAINELVAEYLHKISDMLRVMGMDIITTGFRPELAQAAVNSGVDLFHVKTFSTVKEALLSIE